MIGLAEKFFKRQWCQTSAIRRWPLLCVFIVCVSAVGAKDKTQKNATQALGRFQLGFDPVGLPQDRVIVPRAFPVIARQLDSSVIKTPGAVDSSTSSGPYDSYQAQIFNSNSYNEALQEKSIAEEIFPSPVRLDFEAPFFKVRVGDFRDKKAAEEFLERAVKPAGYRDAWIVRLRIQPPTKPPSTGGALPGQNSPDSVKR